MTTRIFAATALFIFVFAGGASAQSWSLQQNDPDPFCNDSGSTAIRFAVAQAAVSRLEIWSPDTTAIIRTLVNGVQQPGNYVAIWDGRDDANNSLPEGPYPYSFNAIDPNSGGLLFYDMRAATISCATPAEPETWGRIKARPADPK